jgi:hypothetical protein
MKHHYLTGSAVILAIIMLGQVAITPSFASSKGKPQRRQSRRQVRTETGMGVMGTAMAETGMVDGAAVL